MRGRGLRLRDMGRAVSRPPFRMAWRSHAGWSPATWMQAAAVSGPSNNPLRPLDSKEAGR